MHLSKTTPAITEHITNTHSFQISTFCYFSLKTSFTHFLGMHAVCHGVRQCFFCQDGCRCGIKISSIQTRSPTPSQNKLCLLWVENKPVFICGVWGGRGVKCVDCELGGAKGLYLPVCHYVRAMSFDILNILYWTYFSKIIQFQSSAWLTGLIKWHEMKLLRFVTHGLTRPATHRDWLHNMYSWEPAWHWQCDVRTGLEEVDSHLEKQIPAEAQWQAGFMNNDIQSSICTDVLIVLTI